jgi:hypothetical protein
MPSKKYYLNREKTEVFELSWSAGFRVVSVLYNEQLLSTMNREEVSAGKTIELPDGRIVDIKLEGGFFTALTAKINGNHIPGTQGDPRFQLRQIFYLLIVLGLLNIIIGFIFANSNVQIKEFDGIGYVNVGIGILYITLGYAITKGSMPALIITTILMFADLILTTIHSSQTQSYVGVFIKIFFIYFITRGFKYMREFNATNKSSQNNE